jgi:hypothetical protein
MAIIRDSIFVLSVAAQVFGLCPPLCADGNGFDDVSHITGSSDQGVVFASRTIHKAGRNY